MLDQRRGFNCTARNTYAELWVRDRQTEDRGSLGVLVVNGNNIDFDGALRYASEASRANIEFVKAAVQADGDSLQWAHGALRDDFGIVKLAVSQSGYALEPGEGQAHHQHTMLHQYTTPITREPARSLARHFTPSMTRRLAVPSHV